MIQGQNQDWGTVRTTSKSKISTQHIWNLLQNARGLCLVPWTFASEALTARMQGSNLKLVKSGSFPPPLLKQQTPSPPILPGQLYQFTSSHQVGRRGTQVLLYKTPAAKRLFCSGLSALLHLQVSLQTCCIPSFSPLPFPCCESSGCRAQAAPCYAKLRGGLLLDQGFKPSSPSMQQKAKRKRQRAMEKPVNWHHSVVKRKLSVALRGGSPQSPEKYPPNLLLKAPFSPGELLLAGENRAGPPLTAQPSGEASSILPSTDSGGAAGGQHNIFVNTYGCFPSSGFAEWQLV